MFKFLKTVGKFTKKFDEFSTKMDVWFKKIDGFSRKIDEFTKMVELSKKVNEFSKKLFLKNFEGFSKGSDTISEIINSECFACMTFSSFSNNHRSLFRLCIRSEMHSKTGIFEQFLGVF